MAQENTVTNPEATTGATPPSNAEAQQQQLDNMTVSQVDGTTRVEVNPANISLDPDANAQATPPEANTQGEGTGEAGAENGGEGNAESTVQAEISKQIQTEQEVKADLASKGVDFDALAKEYEQSGELSADSMKKLEAANYPKAVVDAYLEGLSARTEKFVATVKGYAGGDKEFSQLQSFIASQPKDVVDGFNAAINSGNLNQIKLTIAGLKAEMTKAYGTANPTIMANRAVNNTETQGYTSWQDMTKDMRDPRYNVDPVFTREVYAKVKAAKIF